MNRFPLFLLLVGCHGGSLFDSDTAVEIIDDSDSATDTDTGDPGPPAYRCDLLVNGDAETGDFTGWTIEEGDWQAVSGSDTTPRALQGDYSFFAGQNAFTRVSQSVDVSTWAAAADGELLAAHLVGQVRDWDGDDEVSLGLIASDVDGVALAEASVGPYTNSLWRERRVHLALPLGTRSVQVVLESTRNQGSDNDGYFDDLMLCVDESPVPEMGDLRRGPWLNWVTQDAISVLWETSGDVVGSVEYGTTRAMGDTVTENVSGDHHEVRLDGLSADTAYYYRLVSDGAVGETFMLHTAPSAAVPFSFVVWGDNQNGPDVFGEVVDGMERLSPEFALSVGDIVQDGTESNYRDELLDPIQGISPEVPFFVAGGNHERYGDGDGDLFDLHLAQPQDEHCFGWTYGGVYFLFIDSELDVSTTSLQYQCITDALSSAEFAASDIQVALFHKPPRVQYWAWWYYDDALPYDGWEEGRDTIEPLLDLAGVDLVFNGHNHLYTYIPSGEYSDVAWVTTGGGGGSIDGSEWKILTHTWSGMRQTIHEHHFLSVSVTGDQMSVEAIGLDGTPLHSFVVFGD